MSEFESGSAAALQRIKDEIGPPVSPEIKLAGKFSDLAGVIAELFGIKHAFAAQKLFRKLLDIAPSKDEANLIYVTEWIVSDIHNLYRLVDEETKRRIENFAQTKEVTETLANSISHITRTNIEARLQRLAHIFVNGLKEYDLDVEDTDDMMRAAVELKEEDIELLRKLYASQSQMVARYMKNMGQSPDGWHGEIQSVWRDFVNHGGLNPQKHLQYRSSLSRLESLGLVQQIDINNSYGVGLNIYALLIEGKVFCERIRAVGTQE